MLDIMDMPWQERKLVIREALDAALPSLGTPATTTALAQRIARTLAASYTGVVWNLIAGEMLKLASEHAHATHDGPAVQRYGRLSKAWRWHPTAQREGTLAPVVRPYRPVDPSRLAYLERLVAAFKREHEDFAARHDLTETWEEKCADALKEAGQAPEAW